MTKEQGRQIARKEEYFREHIVEWVALRRMPGYVRRLVMGVAMYAYRRGRDSNGCG